MAWFSLFKNKKEGIKKPYIPASAVYNKFYSKYPFRVGNDVVILYLKDGTPVEFRPSSSSSTSFQYDIASVGNTHPDFIPLTIVLEKRPQTHSENSVSTPISIMEITKCLRLTDEKEFGVLLATAQNVYRLCKMGNIKADRRL
jgi:hypothetical protein